MKISICKPEILKAHNIPTDEFDFSEVDADLKDKLYYADLLERFQRLAKTIPDDVVRTAIGIGDYDDIIEALEKFINAGTNHFLIKLWRGERYFGIMNCLQIR